MKKYFLLEETEEDEDEYSLEVLWDDIKYILDKYGFEYSDSSYSTSIFTYTAQETEGYYTPNDYDSVKNFEEDCPSEVAYYLSADLKIDEYTPWEDCYLDIKLLLGNFPKQLKEQLTNWVSTNLSFNLVKKDSGEFEGHAKIDILSDPEELRDLTKLADKVYDIYTSMSQFINQKDIEFQNQLANINAFVSAYPRQVLRTIIEVEENETWVYDGSIYSLSTPSIILTKTLNNYKYLIGEDKFIGDPRISIVFYNGDTTISFKSFNNMFDFRYSIDEITEDLNSLSPIWDSYYTRGDTIEVESKHPSTMDQEELFKFFKEADAIVKYFEDNFTIQEI